MPISLSSYPVTTSSGKVRNVFAGFQAVEIVFERKDISVINVSQGVDNKALITVSGDITGSLNVGEWIYLFSSGTSSNYDGSFQVISIVFSSPNTEITVDTDFFGTGTSGWINYKQNYFLEAKLVDPTNNLVLKYPQLLQNDGSPAGIIEINTSMLVDFLKNDIKTTSQEITTSREECKIMYREVWREDDTAVFTLLDLEPIVIIFAAEDSEVESFVNEFETPRIWDGYPFFLNLLHSNENESGKKIFVTFDELDINKANINTDNQLVDFDVTDFGILQADFGDKVKVIEDETRFITFNANSSGNADYETGDYDDNDYQTINTP